MGNIPYPPFQVQPQKAAEEGERMPERGLAVLVEGGSLNAMR